MSYTNNAHALDAILTNGRTFAAMVGETVYMPGGHAVTLDQAESMGFDECADATRTDLTAKCRAALDNAPEPVPTGIDTRKQDGRRAVPKDGQVAALIYRGGKVVGHNIWVHD